MTEITEEWQYDRSISPRGFERMIERLGLSVAGASRFLGVSERTAHRYISGHADIPPSVVLLLRLMLKLDLRPVVPRRVRYAKEAPTAQP